MKHAVDTDRFRKRLQERGMTQSGLARQLEISQGTIAKLALGESAGSKHLHRIARALGTTAEYLTGEIDDPAEGATPPPSAEELADELGLVAIKEIDLTLGLGGAYIGEGVVSEVERYLPLAWLREFTRADPQYLRVARTRGDSMKPTLSDGDLAIIDIKQNSIREQDAVWAIAVADIGMIKRIWANPDGSYKIKSDNPNVDPETAVDGEMFVLGQVVGKLGKL
ncbi:XRE family transcriptional regulator [Sphingopyxis sp. NFH-91]|uniref:XRE family transcriptional regulator n=1 Tax=Sphingopyxis sp. NFH-91 TaxID=2744457 RepID=UPI001F218704|nr:XRE family transcriptional regulator [Sphingopyxis sp. NFH-91]